MFILTVFSRFYTKFSLKRQISCDRQYGKNVRPFSNSVFLDFNKAGWTFSLCNKTRSFYISVTLQTVV